MSPLKSSSSHATCIIRSMQSNDNLKMAKIHKEIFSRQFFSEEWISCNFAAFPRIRYFVAEQEGELIGYVQWTEKSGFRTEVILELEQIAVLSSFQRKGVGTKLITQSLAYVKHELILRGATIKYILVTTRNDNEAQKLYEKSLNAVIEATIPDLFSGDEILMIARNPNI